MPQCKKKQVIKLVHVWRLCQRIFKRIKNVEPDKLSQLSCTMTIGDDSTKVVSILCDCEDRGWKSIMHKKGQYTTEVRWGRLLRRQFAGGLKEAVARGWGMWHDAPTFPVGGWNILYGKCVSWCVCVRWMANRTVKEKLKQTFTFVFLFLWEFLTAIASKWLL